MPCCELFDSQDAAYRKSVLDEKTGARRDRGGLALWLGALCRAQMTWSIGIHRLSARRRRPAISTSISVVTAGA